MNIKKAHIRIYIYIDVLKIFVYAKWQSMTNKQA